MGSDLVWWIEMVLSVAVEAPWSSVTEAEFDGGGGMAPVGGNRNAEHVGHFLGGEGERRIAGS